MVPQHRKQRHRGFGQAAITTTMISLAQPDVGTGRASPAIGSYSFDCVVAYATMLTG
jgi:hypothetical protein